MKKDKHNSVWLIDSTLRDGEQAPGVAFRPSDKIAIARMLADAGVDESEVGIPIMGNAEQETIRAIAELKLPLRLTCWCRARYEDIEAARVCQTGSVHISFPVSSIHLNAMGKSQSWVLGQLRELLAVSLQDFAYVSVGAQDATRADAAFLAQFVRTASSCGAYRIRIADTVGIATPNAVMQCIRELSHAAGNADIEFHAHNDLGMATANTVSAVEAGAKAVSVTVNGLGERAGNAPLEEVAAALRFGTGHHCRTDPGRLMALCEYLARISRRPIPASKPITGSAVFTHESGIHCDGLLKDPRTYEPFLPESVGRKTRDFVVGKHSGTAVIHHVLGDAGISIDLMAAEKVLGKVRSLAAEKGEGLSVPELVGLL